jgi:hypothetical protein
MKGPDGNPINIKPSELREELQHSKYISAISFEISTLESFNAHQSHISRRCTVTIPMIDLYIVSHTMYL